MFATFSECLFANVTSNLDTLCLYQNCLQDVHVYIGPPETVLWKSLINSLMSLDLFFFFVFFWSIFLS